MFWVVLTTIIEIYAAFWLYIKDICVSAIIPNSATVKGMLLFNLWTKQPSPRLLPNGYIW
jgi:hypothetical protein